MRHGFFRSSSNFHSIGSLSRQLSTTAEHAWYASAVTSIRTRMHSRRFSSSAKRTFASLPAAQFETSCSSVESYWFHWFSFRPHRSFWRTVAWERHLCGQRTFSAAGAFPGRCPWSPRWEVRLRNRCVEQLAVWQIYRGRTDDENITRGTVSGDWSWTRGFAHCKSTGRREHFLGRRKTVAYHPDLPLLVASMGMNGEKLVDFRIAVCRTYRVPSRTIGSRGLRFTKWA